MLLEYGYWTPDSFCTDNSLPPDRRFPLGKPSGLPVDRVASCLSLAWGRCLIAALAVACRASSRLPPCSRLATPTDNQPGCPSYRVGASQGSPERYSSLRILEDCHAYRAFL